MATGLSVIDRREAIRRVSAMLGGIALVSESALLTGCRDRSADRSGEAARFTSSDVAFLDEVAETILPATKTPGAKAAKVGAFMALMVTDAYEPSDQKIFREGIQKLDDACRTKHNTAFMSATPEQRTSLLEEVDREQKTYMDGKAEDAPAHYFRMMKELTLTGYFTSEIGYTQAMRYTEAPGRFDPCIPYTPGETIWASHA